MGTTAIQIAELLTPQAPRPRMVSRTDRGQSDGLLAGLPQADTQNPDAKPSPDSDTSGELPDRPAGASEDSDAAFLCGRSQPRRSQDDSEEQTDGGKEIRVSFAALLDMLASSDAVQLPDGASIEAVAEEAAVAADGQTFEIVFPQVALEASGDGDAAAGEGQKLMLVVPVGKAAGAEGASGDKTAALLQAGAQTKGEATQNETLQSDVNSRILRQIFAGVGSAGKVEVAQDKAAAEATADGLGSSVRVQRQFVAAEGHQARQAGEGEANSLGEVIRRRLGLAEDSGAELGPSVRVRAAVESEAGRGDAAQAVRTAEAVQNVAKDNGANQSPRNASQSSPATTRNTAELQQAVAGESSQASQNGGKGGPSSDANVSASAEKFQEALRKLSGADAEVSVSGKGRASGRAEQAQSAAQVTAEAPAGAGQSQPAQATAATTGSRSAASQIAETVAENVNAGQIRSGRQLTVRLNPPELGSVRITFEANGEQLRGVLEVSNPRTLGELQREMPALMSRLSESGVQLRRMDLDLADNGGSGNSHLSDFADSQTQTSQRGASEVETPGEPLGQSAGGAETATAEVPSSTQIDDDAINVWI